MKYRIAMWASLGFLVASCWAVYAIGNRAVHEPPDAACVVHGPLAPDLSRDHGRQIVPASSILGCCCECGYLWLGGFDAGNTARAMVPFETGVTLKRLRWLEIVG